MKRLAFACLKIGLIIAILFSAVNAFAQVEIKGTVSDAADSKPIQGATVSEKNTKNIVLTDAQGRFAIKVTDQTSILVFSNVGYKTLEQKVNSATAINISLQTEAKQLGDVIVIGYGTMKKSDLTGAVGSVRGDDMRKSFATDPTAALQGRVSGVTIENNGGEPGAKANIFIRGISSFTNANPLYVINGLVGGSLSDLNPNDIESIEILKDASSCAIYGAAGGNGVVLITTKSGSRGKLNGNVSVRSGFNWAKMLDVLYADEYAQLITERNFISSNGYLPPPAWVVDAQKVGKGTDWQGEMFDPGVVQDYNFSLDGGSNDVNYRIGGGYIGELGSLKGVSSDKITLVGRVDINRKKWKSGIDLSVVTQNRKTNMWGGGDHTKGSKMGIMSIAMYNPLFTVDGSLPGSNQKWYETLNAADYGASFVVPPSFFIDNFKGGSRYNRLDARSYFEVLPIPDLSIRAQLLYGFNNDNGGSFAPSFLFGEGLGMMRYDINQVWEYMNENHYWNTDLFSTYTKSFKNHKFKLMAGANFNYSRGTSRNMTGTQTPSNDIRVITAASEGVSITGGLYESANVAYFGRFNYDFSNKYLLQVTYRRDGTSRFGPGYKWGGFPAVSAAWRVSDETFFEPLKAVISDLKLRGGYGTSGNSNIGDYRYSNYVKPTLSYTIGRDQRKWTGTNVRDFASPDVFWETSEQFDAGADLGLANGMFTLEYNYFDKYSKDLLIEMPLPVESGGNVGQDGRVYRNPYMNFGKMRNWGHEATLTFHKRRGEFSFDISLSGSYIRNKVLKMGYEGQRIFGGGIGGPSEFQTSVIMAGETVASFYLIPTDGLFNDQHEIDSYTTLDPATGGEIIIQPQARPGDIKYVDTNGDGKITTDDRVIMGDAFPDFVGGLGFDAKYKNFDLSVFITAVLGVDVMNGTLARMTVGPATGYGNVLRDYWENHWTLGHTERNDARWPINLNETNNINERPSDRYMDNGSHVRLRNIQLGYTLPQKWCKRLGMQRARLYISAQNLITLTKYIGYDPEVGGGHLFGRGVDGGGTPLSRTTYGGIEITF